LSLPRFTGLNLSKHYINFFSGDSFTSQDWSERVHQEQLNTNQFGE